MQNASIARFAAYGTSRQAVRPAILGARLPQPARIVRRMPMLRAPAASSGGQPTIYEKLGGKEAVSAAVDIFYGKVLADDRIKHFFDNIDMGKQRSKQMLFMMYAFGGPNEYKGRNMYDAHHGLHLTDEHFNAVAECFVSTLKELGVEQELIDDAVGVVASTHDQVVGH